MKHRVVDHARRVEHCPALPSPIITIHCSIRCRTVAVDNSCTLSCGRELTAWVTWVAERDIARCDLADRTYVVARSLPSRRHEPSDRKFNCPLEMI